MVLIGFHTMLHGARLHIHTHHLNNTTNNNSADHIICWLNYVDQFNPHIHFIPGKANIMLVHYLALIALTSLSFPNESKYLLAHGNAPMY